MEHTHEHSHSHGHEHAHDHGHNHGQSEAEQFALLEYLAVHNQHHLEELEALRTLPDFSETLDAALEAYRAGNALLEEYLNTHKRGE